MKTIVVTPEMSPKEQEIYAEIKKKEDEIRRATITLLASFKTNDEIKKFLALVGYERVNVETYNSTKFKATLTPRVYEVPDGPTETPKPAPAPIVRPLHMDPKTVNILLTGSILNAAEKRRLLSRIVGNAAGDILDSEKEGGDK